MEDLEKKVHDLELEIVKLKYENEKNKSNDSNMAFVTVLVVILLLVFLAFYFIQFKPMYDDYEGLKHIYDDVSKFIQ